MKKPFEQYLAFIEHELGCKLFNWQKNVLRYVYNGEHLCYYPARGNGVTILEQAILILYMAMEKEN